MAKRMVEGAGDAVEVGRERRQWMRWEWRREVKRRKASVEAGDRCEVDERIEGEDEERRGGSSAVSMCWLCRLSLVVVVHCAVAVVGTVGGRCSGGGSAGCASRRVGAVHCLHARLRCHSSPP